MKIVEGGFCQRREANPGHGALGESCLERLEMRIQIRVVRAKCCQKRRSFVKNIFLGWEMVVQKPQLVGGDVDGFGQRESGGRSRFHLRLGIESTDREDGKVAFGSGFGYGSAGCRDGRKKERGGTNSAAVDVWTGGRTVVRWGFGTMKLVQYCESACRKHF